VVGTALRKRIVSMMVGWISSRVTIFADPRLAPYLISAFSASESSRIKRLHGILAQPLIVAGTHFDANGRTH
jgi:hypothetical protein